MRTYLGLIHKDADSDFGVSFPDFPGCATAGSTLEEARVMAQEALCLHIEGMLADGETIPAPSSLDEVMADPENRDGVVIVVPAPARQVRTTRVNITMPEDVLEAIDQDAERRGMTRSGYLTVAARRMMDAA